jgi:DNA gyrase subunit B
MSKEYNAGAISILEFPENVRCRAAMYIGDTEETGFHHLLWEIVDNSVDEAINGHAKNIAVFVEDDFAEVTDDGRGIPFDIHPKTKTSALDVIFTTLHAGGKFDNDAYKNAGGLHGVGSSVVNALSEFLCVSSRRDGKEATREYSRGIPEGRLSLSPCKGPRGTTVSFRPDPQIFGSRSFVPETVRERLRVRAYLNPGVSFTLNSSEGEEVYKFNGGLADYLAEIVGGVGKPVTDFPFVLINDEPRVQVALMWTEETTTLTKSYANAIPTRDGGTHEKGVDAAIISTVRDFLDDHEAVPKRLKISPADIREGLITLISVFVESPQFQGQTKDRLNNPEVSKSVEGILKGPLRDWLRKNSSQSTALVKRIVRAAQARTAARAASEAVTRATPISRLRLPGKLADCSSNSREATELFLVEGDSAGGSAKQARDRETQAILPLRGKILNSASITLAKALQNEELRNIVEALGCGIGQTFNINKLRYGKVILLMDADSDGDHIAVLALTFFFRFLPELIMDGRIYLAVPPLYRVDIGKKSHWVRDDKALSALLDKYPKSSPEVTRFKGLGEMPPPMLWQTAMNPATRSLEVVQIAAQDADITEDTILGLLGKNAETRFNLLMGMMQDGSISVSV